MIVRFITLVYLVPMSRLELLRLSPPPPQDGVATNFTTSAIETCLRHRPQPLIRDLPSLRAGAARGRGALGTTRRNHVAAPQPCVGPVPPDSASRGHSTAAA